jgi:putative nucleotidyltransferase with HDIG domain
MQNLLDLAEKITDRELKKKVVDFLKNPTLSHKDFKKYPREEIEKAKTVFVVAGQAGERDVLNHTVAVTEACISIADTLMKNFKMKINKDYLIAACLLHDMMKLFEWKISGDEPEHTGIPLDHTMLITAELYSRQFPEEVIHIVASHAGEHGTTPPRTVEAFILHNVDSMLSVIEHQLSIGKSSKQIPVLLLDEETLKKLSGKVEE